ncbi:hypothetical protein D9M68_614950 [compost metagenome]
MLGAIEQQVGAGERQPQHTVLAGQALPLLQQLGQLRAAAMVDVEPQEPFAEHVLPREAAQALAIQPLGFANSARTIRQYPARAPQRRHRRAFRQGAGLIDQGLQLLPVSHLLRQLQRTGQAPRITAALPTGEHDRQGLCRCVLGIERNQLLLAGTAQR